MKKIITILGLLLIPLGITNAGFTRQFDLLNTVKTVGGNSNIYSTSSYFRANSNGTLYTSYLGASKPVFYTYYDTSGAKRFWIFYWDNNGLPYIYSYAKNGSWELDLQGNFTKYSLCDYISSVPTDSVGYSGPGNCTTNDIGAGFSEFLGNFFSSIVPSDKYYYRTNYGVSSNSYVESNFDICFSNSSLEQSICFTANGRAGPNVGNYTNTELVNSVGYLPTLDFASLNINENKPGNSNTNTTPTEQYTCPTIQQLINTYPEQYNVDLCYSNNLIYSGGQFTTITPKTIFELYPTYAQLQNDINNYNNYCKAPNTQETCQGAFNGKNEEYTLISKIPQDVMPLQLYAYCNLTLNQDPNSTTCTASTGAINNGIGIDDVISNIGKTPITVITPGTPPDAPEETGNQNIYGQGSVFDKYKQDEDPVKRRNIIRKAEDTIQTMREIYTKLTGIFRARNGTQGVIPPLITGLVALIILFKLFKK